jgi:hypothetical protein
MAIRHRLKPQPQRAAFRNRLSIISPLDLLARLKRRRMKPMRQLRSSRLTLSAHSGWVRAGQAGLTMACLLLATAELQAGDPVAEARWYCPYTPEGDCTPYTRSFGYTPTRWRKWPAATDPGKKVVPEDIRRPAPVAPKAAEELPVQEDVMPDNPGPSAGSDDFDLAPPPPGGAPGLPSDMNGGDTQPDDMHDLFPEETPSPKKPSAQPDSGKGDAIESDTKESDEADQATPSGGASRNRHGARQTSYNAEASNTNIVWRRSKRLGPAEPRSTATNSLRPQAPDATRSPAAAAKALALPTGNPLRDAQAAGSGSGQLQAWAGADAVPTTSFSTAAPAVRANPLRDSQ